jgi:DNA-binding GntR family transcriptional regulator
VATYGQHMIELEPDRPVWLQVYEIIRSRIDEGTYAPRMPLPSSARLVQEFGIARGTARKVLDRLVEDGVARTVPGKGTFVVGTQDDAPAGE